jgi:phage-related tail protein
MEDKVAPPWFAAAVQAAVTEAVQAAVTEAVQAAVTEALKPVHSKLGDMHSKLGDMHSKLGDMHSKLGDMHSKLGDMHNDILITKRDVRALKCEVKSVRARMLDGIGVVDSDGATEYSITKLREIMEYLAQFMAETFEGKPHEHAAATVKEMKISQGIRHAHMQALEIQSTAVREQDHERYNPVKGRSSMVLVSLNL